ncbi:FAD-dependent monooxygenase [Nocardiopsis alborubida]|uniref:Monooxygenase n=2 Tax=Nocardiopsis TaxID=2013 RepID=A0A7X6MC09_9ACTN|nr:FAD-dependent monooxygenase [Nocardiopsis alborubida]NKY97183.1 monooxygenase [Nocardiopsis alborubida]QOP59268.1 FAD-binding monooxygenase [Nocardiopsis sp.]
MESPVIIVGAGPAGMMLAGELALAGVRPLVLERLAEPSGESRGLGFGPRTMEIFEQRALLARFGEITPRTAGHFGGVPLDFSVVDGAHFSVDSVPQSRTEEVLGGWLEDLGVRIRRGVEVTGLSQDEYGVDVETVGPGGPETIRASYLVGCDGGRSTVRTEAGFDFPGTPPTLEMYIADVAGCSVRPRPIGEPVAGGMAMAAPIAEGVDRIVVCELGNEPGARSSTPLFGEVAASWKRITGEDISHGTPRWVSSFTDSARLVSEYRRGRVLLAGDAAHVHLPAGGQGMNVGVQDAFNLGWKLAARVRGQADDALLDTYHSERHPVGERLLRNTRAQGTLILGGDASRPLREVLTELVAHDDVAHHLAAMVAGLDVRYDVGPDSHPLSGLRLPRTHLVVEGRTTTTAELLRTGRGLLLDLSEEPGQARTALPWSDRVDTVSARLSDQDANGPLAATVSVLVRPDGHVAWTSLATADLTGALNRWFGPPTDQPAA